MSQRAIADDERLKGRRCGIDNCPSKRYFKVDGRIVCDYGHEQNFLQTAEDDEARVPSGVRRYKIGDASEAEERKRLRLDSLQALSVEANEFLYLRCYQYVLHGQVKSLINLGLPMDLEGVVKDLWALYLTTLPVKIVEEAGRKRTRIARDSDGDDEDYIIDFARTSDEELSSDENVTSAGRSTSRERGYRSSITELGRYPSLLTSIIFLYFAMLTLKLPITLSDIVSWIRSEQLPYIRADRLVPPDMLNRLHARTRLRFAMTTKLDPGELHYLTNQLADFYNERFKITMPPLNHPPILWKFASKMSFPIETYSIASRIAKLLKFDEFRWTLDAKWQRAGGYPDSKLMALLIVACKLGFDIEHVPAWKSWAMATEDEVGKEKWSKMEDIDEQDILTMSDEQLDGYMDWVQSRWIDDNPQYPGKGKIRESILGMFPLDEIEQHSPSEAPPRSSNFFMFLQPQNDSHTDTYSIYRPSACLPPVLQLMVQRGASIVGVEESALRYSIRWVESELNQWNASTSLIPGQ